jgi:hypothetical protein
MDLPFGRSILFILEKIPTKKGNSLKPLKKSIEEAAMAPHVARLL